MYVNTYIKYPIKNIQFELTKYGWQLFKTAISLIKPVYFPELDVSPVLEKDQSNYYQPTVGQPSQTVELRWIDINTEISLLCCYRLQPRHSNHDQVFQNFAFFKSHTERRLVLDPFKNDFDGELTAYDWECFYGEVQEDLSDNAKKARGEK